jgi:hypothetical protein
MVSFMRFKQRRNVDLPHPEGPISAVTLRGSISMLMFESARDAP